MTHLVVNNLKMVLENMSIFLKIQIFYRIGHYKIGVHIADVSYFVQEQTSLDNEASQRTTSVYLVERVKYLFISLDKSSHVFLGYSYVTTIIM